MKISNSKHAFTLAEVFQHTLKSDLKGAFTLAEVLITLGVVGVVAALTLPALISHHNKRVVETRLQKFYSTMQQAVRRAEVDFGPKSEWDVLGTGFEKDDDGNDTDISIAQSWFDKYIEPYVILLDKRIDPKTGKVLAYFPDGSMVAISSVSIIFVPKAKDFDSRYITDDDGNSRNNAEISGKKYFTFRYYSDKGVEPYYKNNWDVSEEELRNNDSIGCKKDVSNERAYCTALIQRNGWKIPKDYPVGF